MSERIWSVETSVTEARHDTFGSFVSVAELENNRTGPQRGRLSGYPFVAKDNLDTCALPTTANTPGLLGTTRKRDNPVIAALAAEGGQLIGKTNMHELALGITTNAAAFPATSNPKDRLLVAGGSSGGSAAAVASRIVPFALGTDTGGSISIPAAWCGVFGLRPTTGRWPSGGVVPLSPTRDTVGVIGVDVDVLSLVDAVVCKVPPREAAKDVLTPPLRLGVPKSTSMLVSELDSKVQLVWDATLKTLGEESDIELVDVDPDSLVRLEQACGTEIELYEISYAISNYLDTADLDMSFGQLLEATSRSDVREMLRMSWRSRKRHEQYYRAMQTRQQLQLRYAHLFDSGEISALLFPTTPIMVPHLLAEGSPSRHHEAPEIFAQGTRNVNSGSVAGQPVVTIPLDSRFGHFGVGLSIEGRRFQDRQVLAIANRLSELVSTSQL